MFFALVFQALELRGVIDAKAARWCLFAAWCVAVVGIAGSLENAPARHRLLAGGLTAVLLGAVLVLLDRWTSRRAALKVLNRLQRNLLEMIDKGKSSFAAGDFYPDAKTNYFDAVRKFQSEASELIRLEAEGYVHQLKITKDSLEGRLYVDYVGVIQGLTAKGRDALKKPIRQETETR